MGVRVDRNLVDPRQAIGMVRAVVEWGRRFDRDGVPTEFSSGFSLACEEIECRLLEMYGLPPTWRLDSSDPEGVLPLPTLAPSTGGV